MKNKILSLLLVLILAASFAGPVSATISTTASNTIVYGTGSQNVFQFQFVADSPSDIQVIYTNADGQQTTLAPTAYLVAINNPAPGQLWGIGGTVTYPLSGSPIAAGTSLTISRILPLI